MVDVRVVRGFAVAGVVVTLALGVLVLRALDDREEAWSAYALAEREMADLESIIGARLEEATGHGGVDGRYPTEDERFDAQLDRLVERAPDQADAALLAEAIRASEDALRADAEADGAADERLLAELDGDLSDLNRAVVRPLAEDASSSDLLPDHAALVVAFVVALGLWPALHWKLVIQPKG